MDDAYTWLEDFFKNRVPDRSLVLSSLLPSVFDRYFIIEQNYGIIDDFPFDEYPEDKEQIASLNKRHDIERQFGLFLNYDNEDLYRPVSIRELASIFNVKYSKDTVSEIKPTPGVACLPGKSRAIFERLVTLLVDGECRLYIQDAHRYPTSVKYAQKNTILSGDDYMSFVDEMGLDYCSYLFPVDRQWCLVSFEDVDNPVLTCNDKIAAQLPGIEGLEYFEIDLGTKLSLAL